MDSSDLPQGVDALNRLRIGALILSIAIGGCSAPPSVPLPSPGTTLPAGEHYLVTPAGKVWYKVSGGGAGTPVILIHGGPGFPSYYMKPLEALGADRLVVRYDQLGGGKSDRVTDTTLFVIPRFVAEVEQIRRALGYRKISLYGLSWGTIVAVEYYRAHPDRVQSLVLGGAFLDIPAWTRNSGRLLATLPDSTQATLAAGAKSGDFHSREYQAAESEFYNRYVWRRPREADLDSTMSQANEVVYNYMQGPNEFTITGTLRDYDATPFLPRIRVPVFYTTGEYDEADPALVRRFASLTPGAKVVVFKDAAHLTPWDAPEENVRVVREFLAGVDSAH